MGCGASSEPAPPPAAAEAPVEDRGTPAKAPAPAPEVELASPAAPAPAPAEPPPPVEDDPVCASAAAQVYSMLKKQEGKDPVDKNEAGRYFKALVGCYKPAPPPTPDEVKALTEGDGTMGEAEFVEALGKLPSLLAKVEADWDSSTGKFVKFRTCEDQLSKLLGNLDRLRRKQANGERVDDEIESRKKQVKKFRANGIVPSPAICVFNQIDCDKDRSITAKEFKRLFISMKKVFPVDAAKIDSMMAAMDSDSSGEIDEDEWVRNLDTLPDLKAALAADIDPDTGRLRSYRSPRQQFAKLLGNIDRLEYDQSKGKDVAEELASRRKQADRCRMAGIHPSAGIVVFNQLDKKKTGNITKEQLTNLFSKMGYEDKSVEDVMSRLDTDKDGKISEAEWLGGLDKVMTLKEALQKDIDPETGKLKSLITSGKAIFDMLRRQEGVYAVDKNEVGRYLKALNAVFKPDNGSLDFDVDNAADELIEAGKEKMTPAEWLELLGTLPNLDKALKEDYDKDRVRFNSFRSCGQQLSKLLGNLDRLRYRERMGEDCADEIASRKQQVKKLRGNGILPSPALSVFNQIDVDKSGSITSDELSRLMSQLRAVYNVAESEEQMMQTLDSNDDGEISEVEWCRNLASLPGLKMALQKDLNPDTGRLKSFRSPRQQFAKLLANIDRLEYDISRGEHVVRNQSELDSRREAANRFRLSGVTPSAGIVVFAQIDKKKTGTITMAQVEKLFQKMEDNYKGMVGGKSAADVLEKLDTDKDGVVSEQEWLDGLDAVPSLKGALENDIDPETGKLKSLITSGKAVFDMLRRQEGTWAVDKNEVARYLNALNAVYKPGDDGLKKLHDEYMAAGKEKLTPDEWLEALATMPNLDAALKADYDRDRVRFGTFRSCGQQLSKLLGNLDRLRYRERAGENVSEEIESRKKQVKKLRTNGIVPSAGLCVYNQVDIDKSGSMDKAEFLGLLSVLKKIFPGGVGQVDKLLETLDTDGDGEISEKEWLDNLHKCPGLKAALQRDLDPATGRLKSFRTPRQQFAKLLANIDRLEYDASKGKDVTAELESRRKQAQRFRVAGITPSAGVMIFEQLDKKKTRKITKEQLQKLFDKMEFKDKSVEEVMSRLDTDKDGGIDHKEWLDGLDAVPTLKGALEKEMDPETGKLKCLITSGRAVFDMLRRQEGAYAVDKKEVGRFLTALNAVFKPEDTTAETAEKLLAEEGKMTPEEWLELLPSMPTLDAKLKEDFDSDRLRFKSFRSCGQQLSKLLGNLDRLRYKLKTASDEEKADIEAKIATRKAQAKKMRKNGILPSPAVSVFIQLDLDKSGSIDAAEFKRMLYSLRKVFPVGEAEVEQMIKDMDTDSSGEIEELEWVQNLHKLPALKAALVKDLDPDTGLLRSYRSKEDQLAKLLGNIMRLEYDAEKGDDVAEELESRKAQAAKMREAGVEPSAGIVVFNQIDKKKERSITKAALQDLLSALKCENKSVEEIMERLDTDEDGTVSEKEWLEGLNRCQDLKAALEADIDPDTGKLKSLAA